MNNKVAIIIPLKNHYDFITRQLKYYESVSSCHPIYIGDSSDQLEKKKLLESIKFFKKKLDIKYFYFPKKPGHEVISDLSLKVKEKFCVFCGADDFLIPNSLNKCANFLQKNKDYRTAQGKAIIFNLDKKGAYGKFNYFGLYWKQPQLTNKSSKDRIMHFSNNSWNSQFSVHRTKEFIEDSKDRSKIKCRTFAEIMHIYTFAAKGKSKFIDCLFLIRQDHEARAFLPNFSEWITSDNWYHSYEIFINSIAKIIFKIDRLKLLEAKAIVNQAFWVNYYDSLMLRKPSNDKLIDYKKFFKQFIPNSLYISMYRKIKTKFNYYLS